MDGLTRHLGFLAGWTDGGGGWWRCGGPVKPVNANAQKPPKQGRVPRLCSLTWALKRLCLMLLKYRLCWHATGSAASEASPSSPVPTYLTLPVCGIWQLLGAVAANVGDLSISPSSNWALVLLFAASPISQFAT
ncbi:hypothetical protein RirG_031900 [Rhizophagus irregularis DAOM 197198w]|uniref:Uncharacterized protein n=1 Tax=Rhizophagus irregularis (strain DAOM 197198w) TaxID=1432141 RepID=A0A015NBK4_RHIIW|nr:hypothetical protein RirG_031900 [Rhizophagus irregularis DAOM 197198w]